MMMSVSTGFPPFYLKAKRRAYIEDGEGGNDVRHEGELHTHCDDADYQAGGILPHTPFSHNTMEMMHGRDCFWRVMM